ncbi:YrdB family protein [Evansella sp. AB-P1]|uniref:YrdB family protein n=1 Tax=Evansella sp. AB-P1 TaxID=3037653 RepID=UPI00241E2463|nr:YrdB family protein [Evansella sp. AB-P1]MDG5790010.1 YrdB family protein [Evansella sp. AB-P1]
MNIGLRFLLELCGLFIYGYWGYQAASTPITKITLAIGIPALVAIIWGVLGSPKAPIQLTPGFRLLFEIIIFGLPIVLLMFLGKIKIAVLYGLITVINKILMFIWNQ